MSDPTNPKEGRRYTDAAPAPTGWVGWIAFAGTMMIILGVFHAMAGLVALFRDEYYLVRPNGLVITLDYTIWGLIHLIIGVIVLLAGFALFRGATWARALTVVVAGVSAVGNLAFLSASPVWAAIMIAVDILVIYAVTVHGREARRL